MQGPCCLRSLCPRAAGPGGAAVTMLVLPADLPGFQQPASGVHFLGPDWALAEDCPCLLSRAPGAPDSTPPPLSPSTTHPPARRQVPSSVLCVCLPAPTGMSAPLWTLLPSTRQCPGGESSWCVHTEAVMAQRVVELRGRPAGQSRAPGPPSFLIRRSSPQSSSLPGVVCFTQGPPAEQGTLGEPHPSTLSLPTRKSRFLSQLSPGMVGVALGV